MTNASRAVSRRRLAALASGGAALVLLATGSVFWRRGAATAFEQDSTLLYSTAAKADGREGRLEVRATKADMAAMSASAAAAAGRPAPARRPGVAYQSVAVSGGEVTHRIVLPGMNGDGAACLVFTRPAKAAKSPDWPAAMPRLAPGLPSFSAELDSTRAALAVVEDSATPADAADAAAAAYAADGWTELPSGAAGATFRMFSKGRAIAAVLAEPSGAGARVTALQRLGSRSGM